MEHLPDIRPESKLVSEPTMFSHDTPKAGMHHCGATNASQQAELLKALAAFNAYFVSLNGVPPNARIPVPTAEWQTLHQGLLAALTPTGGLLERVAEMSAVVQRYSQAPGFTQSVGADFLEPSAQ